MCVCVCVCVYLIGHVPDLSSLVKLTYLGIAESANYGTNDPPFNHPMRCDLIIPLLPSGIAKIDLFTCGEGLLTVY